MEIKIQNRNGITLQTKDKICDENITIKLDDSLFDYTIEDGLVTGTLTYYSNPRVTEFRTGILNGTNVEYVALPNVGVVGTNCFQGCSKLKNVDITNATIVNDQAFFNCFALENINLPKVEKIGSSAFSGCTTLKSICIGNMGQWYNLAPNMIAYCYSLVKIVITHTARVITLTGAFINCYHFDGTVDATYNPDGLKDGLIYVPDELLDSYKSETNWSLYADQIKPLSELPAEE